MAEENYRGRARVLLADDEVTLRDTLAQVLSEEGMEVVTTGDGRAARALLDQQSFDLLISDIKMPGMDGLELLRSVHAEMPSLGVIVITAYGSVDSAVEAMKLGAADYIVKPLLFDDLLLKIRRLLQVRDLRRENLQLRAEVERAWGGEAIIGATPAICQMLTLVDKVAQTRSNVLIVGESGTGKELIARAIHNRGITKDAPFIPVNCGGIPETLLESEMFGHRKGSFTGASRDKVGFFEAADGGTLFLDEVGNLPMGAQMALLRAIEQKAVTRVGDTHAVKFELRIVSATNRDLGELVSEKKFREDLFFRLNVMQLRLPPLRERTEDVPRLVEHFIHKYNAEMKRACSGITPEALRLLQTHPWKGNIRELENVVERALIFAEDRAIESDDLPFQTGSSGSAAADSGWRTTPAAASEDSSGKTLEDAQRQFERAMIADALSRCGYDKNRTAETLGISVQGLYRKIHEHALPLRDASAGGGQA